MVKILNIINLALKTDMIFFLSKLMISSLKYFSKSYKKKKYDKISQALDDRIQ